MGRRVRTALALVFLAFVAVGGLRELQLAFELGRAERLSAATWADAQEAQRSAGALARLPAELAVTRAALAGADAGLRHDPGVWLVARLPWLGPQVQAALDYAGAGAAVTDAASRLAAVLSPDQSAAAAGADPPALQTLTAAASHDPGAMLQIQRDLSRASDQLAAAGAVHAPLLAHFLPPGVQALPARAPQLAILAAVAGSAPALLGGDRPAHYLILGMDETELYPAGGLIGSYGQASVENGAPAALEFSPSSQVGYPWMEANSHFTPPPAPLAALLLAGHSWDLATSGWSPDYAVSAAQADRFVQYSTGHQDDVVVGVDLVTFQTLVDAVGGVSAPQYGVALQRGDPPEQVDVEVLGYQRGLPDANVIGGALAEDLYRKLSALPVAQWPGLLQQLTQLAAGRHIQLYARDPALEQAIVAAGLGGGMGDAAGDYLAVVDANTRSTKLNLTMQQQIDLKLTLNDDGSSDETLTVTYKNDDSAWAAGKDPAMVPRLMCYDPCRPGTLGGLYGGYLRVYLPAGSTISQVTTGTLGTPAEQSNDLPGLVDFGTSLLIPQGGELTVTYTYRTSRGLQPCAAGRCYTLFLRKQAGTPAFPVTVAWRRRSGNAVPASVRLNGAGQAAGSSLSFALDRDQELQLAYP